MSIAGISMDQKLLVFMHGFSDLEGLRRRCHWLWRWGQSVFKKMSIQSLQGYSAVNWHVCPKHHHFDWKCRRFNMDWHAPSYFHQIYLYDCDTGNKCFSYLFSDQQWEITKDAEGVGDFMNRTTLYIFGMPRKQTWNWCLNAQGDRWPGEFATPWIMGDPTTWLDSIQHYYKCHLKKELV